MVVRKAVEAKPRENWQPNSWPNLVELVAAC